MLEIVSHQKLKYFLNLHENNWQHIYSFGRIISKCLESTENYLINSEVFLLNIWFESLLISLFLNKKDSIMILSSYKISILKDNHLKNLKKFGFHFSLVNNEIIFSDHKISLWTLDQLINKVNSSSIHNQRIIFTGIENLKFDLRKILRITLSKRNWLTLEKNVPHSNNEPIQIYNQLKEQFFSRAIPDKKYVFLDQNDLDLLTTFFLLNSNFSNEFLNVNNALAKGWSCWVALDYDNFEWILNVEPLDELYEIKNLLIQNNFIFLSAFRKDYFFQKFLKKYGVNIDLAIQFKSNYVERNIFISPSSRKDFPNNPSFVKNTVEYCKRLVLLNNDFTLILSNDINLKHILATELASQYGRRVFLETLPKKKHSILCSSYDWWIQNICYGEIPKLIILPLLPIPNISEPIVEIIVSHKRRLSEDWFRDYLLPETFETIEKSVSILRRNSGKLVILDPRIKYRKWGRDLLSLIQPSTILN